MQTPWLSLMVGLPVIGAILQVFTPRVKGWTSAEEKVANGFALAASASSGLIGALLVGADSFGDGTTRFREQFEWVGTYSITYDLGLDGLGSLLVLLISIVFPVLITSEWSRSVGRRGIQGLLLLLQTALLGAVCSQDLFLLFFFWALSSVPLYFGIGIWGGEDREAAAFQTVVTSAAGNALLFGALVLVYFSVEPNTFSLAALSGGRLSGQAFEVLGTRVPLEAVVFALMSFGLALRVPVWPIHGWFKALADEAPTSMLAAFLAGVVPVGLMVFVRLGYSLFPRTLHGFSSALVFIGAVNLVVGAICALAQKNLRSLLAYAVVSEIGLMLIGIGSLTSSGLVGATFQVVSFGFAATGLALLVGMLTERAGSCRFADEKGHSTLGGLASRAPLSAVFAAIMLASWLGVPGLSGFVGRSLMMMGGFAAEPVALMLGLFALLLVTGTMMGFFRHVFLGPTTGATADYSDLSVRERLYLLPLAGLTLFFGIYPKPWVERIRPMADALLKLLESAGS